MSREATVTLGALGAQRVRFEYSPGRPGCMYLRNGDPGYPDEPAELWIEEVCIAGVWINAGDFGQAVLDELFAPAEDELLERMADTLQAEADEAADYRQQERRMEEGYP